METENLAHPSPAKQNPQTKCISNMIIPKHIETFNTRTPIHYKHEIIKNRNKKHMKSFSSPPFQEINPSTECIQQYDNSRTHRKVQQRIPLPNHSMKMKIDKPVHIHCTTGTNYINSRYKYKPHYLYNVQKLCRFT